MGSLPALIFLDIIIFMCAEPAVRITALGGKKPHFWLPGDTSSGLMSAQCQDIIHRNAKLGRLFLRGLYSSTGPNKVKRWQSSLRGGIFYFSNELFTCTEVLMGRRGNTVSIHNLARAGDRRVKSMFSLYVFYLDTTIMMHEHDQIRQSKIHTKSNEIKTATNET